jgi:hypothetical protein
VTWVIAPVRDNERTTVGMSERVPHGNIRSTHVQVYLFDEHQQSIDYMTIT